MSPGRTVMRQHVPVLLALALTSFALVVVGGVIGAAIQESPAVVGAPARTSSLGPEGSFNSGLSQAGGRAVYRRESEEEAEPPWGRDDRTRRWSPPLDAGFETSVTPNDRHRSGALTERWERTFTGDDERDGHAGERDHDDDH